MTVGHKISDWWLIAVNLFEEDAALTVSCVFVHCLFWQRVGFSLHLDKERVYYGEHVLINLVSINYIAFDYWNNRLWKYMQGLQQTMLKCQEIHVTSLKNKAEVDVHMYRIGILQVKMKFRLKINGFTSMNSLSKLSDAEFSCFYNVDVVDKN